MTAFYKGGLSLAGAVLLTLAVAGVYGGTLQVPWYLDDYPVIVENPALRHLGEDWPSLLTSSRGLVIFTLALNYSFGGLDVEGYHFVNIAIHLVTSFLVYALCRALWPTRGLLALAGALAFAVHPLQTQAVTYVVQRMTCLSGLFFFLAVYLFFLARKARTVGIGFTAPRHLFPYGGALFAGLLAVAAKENAATLPLALLLVVWLVPLADRTGMKRRFLYVLPFFVVPGWLAAQRVLLPLFSGTDLAALGTAQALASNAMSRPAPLNYLFTEFSVYWLYLRLFFLPIGQALDYGYPVVTTLWTPRTLLALSGLVCLAIASWRVRLSHPLVTLGIAWFFVTLAVESTVIPLDPVFEHRMYVPIFGLVVALFDLLGRIPWLTLRRGVGAGLLLTLAIVAWQRNSLWNDPVSFTEANLRVTPRNERVMVNLAKNYLSAGRTEQAETLLRQALEINPLQAKTYEALSELLIKRGQYHQALELLNQALARSVMSGQLMVDLGVVLDLLGQSQEAERVLRRAIVAAPLNARGFDNLGVVLAGQKRWEEAIGYYQQALKLSPDQAITCFNFGVALANLGRIAEARDQLRRAMELSPRDADALYYYGLLSVEAGDDVAASEVLSRLRQLDARRYGELETKISAKTGSGR